MPGIFRSVAPHVFLFGLAWSVPSHAAPSFALVESFDASKGQTPESVTADRDGNLYFSWSSAGMVEKLTPNGAMSTFEKLPIAASALGVKIGPDGCLYNLSASTTAGSAFVWRTCTPGNVEKFATLDPDGFPNDLAFDDDGNLYVTDSFLPRVYKVSPRGDVSVWVETPWLAGNPADPLAVFHAIGADGIAFDKHQKNLYVTNFDFGYIVRIRFHEGVAGEVSLFASDERLKGSDGIAFDEDGNLLAAVNPQDSLVSIDPRGAIATVAQGGLLDGPSSIVFGTKEGNRRTMYVTSSAFLRASGYEAGTPHPALLSTRWRDPGQRLP